MRQHHPFCLPGRAGGVHDGRQVFRLNIVGTPVKITVPLKISTGHLGIRHEVAEPGRLCHVRSMIHDDDAFNLGQVPKRGNFFVLLRGRHYDDPRT